MRARTILNLNDDEAIHYWMALILLRAKMEDDFKASLALEKAGVHNGGAYG